MINIDKDYLITVDLKNTKVKSDKTIFFYNTDLNICNIFIKLICTDEDKTIPDDLIVEFAVLKPETDEFKPLDATLISKEDLLYQVDLTTDYFDIVGKYSCEIRVSGTIENELKCFTSEEFDYVVKPNITAKLNKKIKNDKNLPILEKLIKDVNDIGLGIEMNQVQLKKDDNLVGDNKSIVGAINQLREDVNSGGKVELKDYQKKTDENLATEEKTIVGAVNEINSKTITLEKDDTSFNGVDDTIHNELNTDNKTIIGGINEVNSQCKDIANKIEQGGTGEGKGLTQTQITALDNMFKVCAYTSSDIKTQYNAFKSAFGIGGSSTDPTKTLTSISATYTGGNVEVGTALTSLTGIAVTATYSDSTTTNVTDYVLTGSILEGSNTITVTYQGKTTTFEVIGVKPSVSNNTNWLNGVLYETTYNENTYINASNGQLTDYANWYSTDYLYCKGASKIRVTALGDSTMLNGNGMYNAMYDDNKNYVKSFTVSLPVDSDTKVTTSGTYIDIDIPTNVSYFRMSRPSKILTMCSVVPYK